MSRDTSEPSKTYTSKRAFIFLLLFGLVSLFSDVAYEGMRSIIGPYLGLLGASAFVISFVAGFSEFVGYALRFLFGRLANKTKRYWLFAFIGYGLNVVVIPALALTRSWLLASALVLMERVAKAIRKPSKDTMTSFVGGKLGHGKAFAFDEFLDQIGATVGPLFVAWIVASEGWGRTETLGAYRNGFAMLVFPALISVGILAISRVLFPAPEGFEAPGAGGRGKASIKENRAFRLYLLAVGAIAFGFADFALIGFHGVKRELVGTSVVPLLYALAMAVDAVAALIFGALFDKRGFVALTVPLALSAPYAGFAFGGSGFSIWLGAVLWGIGMGAQESVFKSAVAQLVDKSERAAAYGTYNSVFGITWFLGSALIGALYQLDVRSAIALSVTSQLLALTLILVAKRSAEPRIVEK